MFNVVTVQIVKGGMFRFSLSHEGLVIEGFRTDANFTEIIAPVANYGTFARPVVRFTDPAGYQAVLARVRTKYTEDQGKMVSDYKARKAALKAPDPTKCPKCSATDPNGYGPACFGFPDDWHRRQTTVFPPDTPTDYMQK